MTLGSTPATALGHVLAGLAHRLEREHLFHARVGEPPTERRVPDDLVPARKGVLGLPNDERRPAHRLDPAGDEELAVSRADGMAGGDDGRETGGTETVDRHAGDLLRKAGEQGRHAGDVAVVLARLVGAAEVDVLDLAGGDARPLHGLADEERSGIVRAVAPE